MPINYEGRVWRKINGWMGNKWWAARVESHMSAGIPDVFFSVGFRSGWMELKSISTPERDGSIKIRTLTDAQINWLHHGNAWLLVEIRSMNLIYLIPGGFVKGKEIDIMSLMSIQMVVEFSKDNLTMVASRLLGRL